VKNDDLATPTANLAIGDQLLELGRDPVTQLSNGRRKLRALHEAERERIRLHPRRRRLHGDHLHRRADAIRGRF
jgi:hypothetical protein